MQKRLLVASSAVFLWSAAHSVLAQDGQTLGNMDGISIVLPPDFNCAQNVQIHLNSGSERPFANESVMARVAGQLQALMSFDCAEAQNIRMLGFVNGSEVYRGQTSAAAGWSVLTMMAPASDSGLESSAQSDLQSQSATTGQSTGDNILATAQPTAQGVRPSPTAKAFDVSDFGQPSIMRALFHGRINEIRVEGFGRTNIADVDSAVFYLASLNDTFTNFRLRDASCIRVSNPMVSQALLSRTLNDALGDDLNMGLDSGQVPTAGFEVIGEMFKMLEEGGMGSIVAMEQAMETLRRTGARDGEVLVVRYGCDSEVVQRIYANIEAYALGRPPQLSEQEFKRQEVERARAEQQRVAEEQRRAAELEEQRQIALRNNATSQCTARFDDAAYCSCIVSALDEFQINENDWAALGRNFDELLSIGARLNGFSSQLRSCRS